MILLATFAMYFDLLGLCLLIFAYWKPEKNLKTSWLNRFQKPGVCMIVSDPEGAEIWLNSKKTKWVTPALIQIPLNQETMIELKKETFLTTKSWIRSSHELSFYYKNLEKFKLTLINPEV